MATIILPASNVANIRTFDLIADILTILGSTTTTFWPFLENGGQNVRSYGEGIRELIPADEAAARNLQDEFEPHKHPGGVHSYYIIRSSNNHLRGTDDAAYTFGNGAADSVFSIGAWVLPREGASVKDIIAKWDESGGAGFEVREWHMQLLATELCQLQLRDESAADPAIVSQSNTTALTLNQWNFIVFTYSGVGGANAHNGINAFLNGALDNGGSSGAANYVAMEDLATPLLIGAGDLTAAPTNEFEGRIALPFVCGTELTATQIAELHDLTRRLLGI